MQKIVCSGCGASDFTELPDGNLKCNYCGSIYFKSPTSAKETTQGTVRIRKKGSVSGTHISGLKFVVHNKLIVDGVHNQITFCSSLEGAEHVSTLDISGIHCNVEVVLADDATYADYGIHTNFRHI